jgi:signal transduction histidine kinase
MWVNGHTLDVGDMRIPITGGGIVPQVFRSGKPIFLERINENPEQFGVIGELGLKQAMVAPLKVEGFNVGAIAVGDPLEGAFAESQLEVFASLAAPAALVLSQLGRYEAAAEMTRRMQEIAQMKTDFVSVVSHELRTPLTSIIGSLDTVNRPELSEEVAKDLLDSARRQAGRLQRLIEDLLMVSRIDRKAIPIAMETVAVRPLLDEVASTIADLEDVSVSVQPVSLQVNADPDHLRRVFINLVENAVKYAPGSPLELVARPIRTHVDIDVIDHGEGIPTGDRHQVFEAFNQLERSDTRTRGGTGLGLSIVKGLVEAMGGRVGLAETPGGGATFTVSLQPATAPLIAQPSMRR